MRIWQRLTMRWQRIIFGDLEIGSHVRALRLLEEVLELCQCEHVTPGEIAQIQRQVYGKPTGLPSQELGGILICLAIYAETRGFDMEEAFWREFERIMDPAIMEKVRHRNLEGDKIGLR